MIYFCQTLKCAHGDITIYVIDGKMKLANVVNWTFKPSFAYDIDSFCNMVESLTFVSIWVALSYFKLEQNKWVSFVLSHIYLFILFLFDFNMWWTFFFVFLVYKLLNSINHIVWLSAQKRGYYMLWTWGALFYLKDKMWLNYEMNVIFNTMKKGVGRSRFVWIAEVIEESYFSMSYFESPYI